MKKIKAILFDSGKVLNKPSTGHWFITPNFFDIIDRDLFSSLDAERVDNTFRKASNTIDKYNFVMNLEEEYRTFLEFYNVFSKCLPELKLSWEDIGKLARDLVYNFDKYIFYEDVFEMIPILKDNYKLAVVSDAWPSIFGVYDKKDLRKYFDAFIVSSMIGVCKPHRKMYESALEGLGVKPDEAIFIDDSLKNCIGAMDLGIKAYLLCRDYEDYIWCKDNYKDEGVTIIQSLKEIGIF